MYSKEDLNKIVKFVSMLCTGVIPKQDIQKQLNDNVPEELRGDVMNTSLRMIGLGAMLRN